MSDESHESIEKGFIVKRRGVIGSARANFACNSATCRTKKGARVYELPSATIRCPVCGSKKIQRLMSAPGISKGISKRTDAMMGDSHRHQQQQHDAAKDRARNAPALGVSMKNGVAGAIREGMDRMGFGGVAVPWAPDATGKARPSGVRDPTLIGVKAQGAVRVPRGEVRGSWRPSAAEVAEARRSV